jgi:vacuolar-type H+-ATPase subunit E/Vma4
LRDTAQAEADAVLAKARREAEQIVVSAKKEAESLRSQGHADAERELSAIKAEVERVSKRRDGIVAQLAALKDVVSSFGRDDDNHDEPAADEASHESGEDAAEE